MQDGIRDNAQKARIRSRMRVGGGMRNGGCRCVERHALGDAENIVRGSSGSRCLVQQLLSICKTKEGEKLNVLAT